MIAQNKIPVPLEVDRDIGVFAIGCERNDWGDPRAAAVRAKDVTIEQVPVQERDRHILLNENVTVRDCVGRNRVHSFMILGSQGGSKSLSRRGLIMTGYVTSVL
jgi:hypothetical protein